MLGIARLDRDHPRIAAGNDMRDLAHVLAWIEQHRQRRIADRPALHLVHRIIDEEQRLAVADDEDRHALFVLEADLAGLLEAERAGEQDRKSTRLNSSH